MMYTLQHKKDGRTRVVNQQQYDAMYSRGDARNWKLVSRSAAVPAEVAQVQKPAKKAAAKVIAAEIEAPDDLMPDETGEPSELPIEEI